MIMVGGALRPLLVGIAVRQSRSRTAMVQASLASVQPTWRSALVGPAR